MIYNLEDTLKEVRELFNNSKDLKATLLKYIDEHDNMRKQIETFQAQAVERTKQRLLADAKSVNGVNVIKSVLPISPEMAKDLVFKIRQAVPENLVCVLGSVNGNKPMLSVMFTDDMVQSHSLNAGKIVREAAKLIKGGGGGQPHYAQAGGKDPDGLSAAVDKVVELCKL